jgi:hypothetical protein
VVVERTAAPGAPAEPAPEAPTNVTPFKAPEPEESRSA